MNIDPVTTEVVASRLREAASSMEHALYHSGYSPILRESKDGTSGLTDADGRVREAFAARVRAWPDALQEEFVRGQGPVAPALVEHLRRERHDRVLFVTYLYPTTYDGLLAVSPGRAFVVPTLHDAALLALCGPVAGIGSTLIVFAYRNAGPGAIGVLEGRTMSIMPASAAVAGTSHARRGIENQGARGSGSLPAA